jgi:hypothetical protein
MLSGDQEVVRYYGLDEIPVFVKVFLFYSNESLKIRRVPLFHTIQ